MQVRDQDDFQGSDPGHYLRHGDLIRRTADDACIDDAVNTDNGNDDQRDRAGNDEETFGGCFVVFLEPPLADQMDHIRDCDRHGDVQGKSHRVITHDADRTLRHAVRHQDRDAEAQDQVRIDNADWDEYLLLLKDRVDGTQPG